MAMTCLSFRNVIVDRGGKVIQEGSPVRLQFEGWPAIQFVGWPSVAVGTFGGEVVFVDATDNGQGCFEFWLRLIQMRYQMGKEALRKCFGLISRSCDKGCLRTGGCCWNECLYGMNSGGNSMDSLLH
jgi:hypothetical protein